MTTAGRPSARRPSAQVAAGIVPAGTELTPRPPWVPDWNRYRLMNGGCSPGTWRSSPASSPRGRADRTVPRLPRRARRPRQHARACPVRQRRERRGHATSDVQRVDAWLGGSRVWPRPWTHRRTRRPSRLYHYPWGWAWAGNAPLQLWKRYAWLGGVRTPLVVHWPGHFRAGAVRRQFCHAIDLFATVLDAVGVAAPEAVDGVAQLPVRGEHRCQLRRSGRRQPAAHPVLEMHGSGHLSRGLEGNDGLRFAAVRGRHFLTGSRTSTTTAGRCSTWTTTSPKRVTLRLGGAAAGGAARAVVGQAGRNQVLPLWEGPKSRTGIHPGEYPPPAEGETTFRAAAGSARPSCRR